MANIAFCFDDKSHNGTYSGGSWDSGLSLNNLKGYDSKHVARSTNDSASNTTFLLDFGFAVSIGIVAIVNHNISDGATVRVRVGPNADGSGALIDETLDPVNFGSDVPAAGKVLFHLFDESVSAQYVLWNITDESNPKGYVQIGRHIAGPVFQPAVNLIHGAQVALIDESRLSRAVDGTQYADLKPLRRRMAGAFDLLTEDEAFGEVYEMQRLCGVTVPMLAIYDPAMTGNAVQRTALYGSLVEMQPLEIVQSVSGGDLQSWRFVLDERA